MDLRFPQGVATGNDMAADPICGMTVDERTALRAERDGQTFYFGSEHCHQKFLGETSQSNPPMAAATDKGQWCCGGGHVHPQSEHGTYLHHNHGVHKHATVLLSPIIAGAAMSLSSVSVIMNALRLRRLRL
jgi:YHS domain-containing protein